jgi:hypothetical protein
MHDKYEPIDEPDVPNVHHVEAPNAEDIDNLARYLVHAGELVKQGSGSSLDGSLKDLDRIQAVLDSNIVEPEASYSLEALGMAFGVVFIEQHRGFDWWMVEDDMGRTPAIQYKYANVKIFPLDMIAKRVEDDWDFRVVELYEALCEGVDELIEELLADD